MVNTARIKRCCVSYLLFYQGYWGILCTYRPKVKTVALRLKSRVISVACDGCGLGLITIIRSPTISLLAGSEVEADRQREWCSSELQDFYEVSPIRRAAWMRAKTKTENTCHEH